MIDTTKYTQLLILKRHWVLAVGVGVTILAITIPLALGLPDIYRSDAHLSVAQQVTPAGGESTWGSLETRLQVIRTDAQSRKNLIDMIEELNLYPDIREKASLDVVIDRVQRDIQFNSQTIGSPNGSTTTLGFTVGYVGDDPEMVAKVANRLANYWVEQNARIQEERVQSIVKIYQNQLNDAQKNAARENGLVAQYAALHADRLPDGLGMKTLELAKKNTQLAAAQGAQTRYKEQLKGLRSDLVEEQQKAGHVASTPDEIEAARLAGEIEKFKATQGDNGPNVSRLRDQLKPITARIDAANRTTSGGKSPRILQLESDISDAQDELDTANEAVGRLTAETKKLEESINSIPARDQDFELLKSDATAAKDSYESVRKSLDAAVLAERTHGSRDSEEFKLEDPARVPKGPYGPPRLNIILGGIFFALVAGIGAAVLRNQLDTSFHTLEELREFTSVPVIGSVPRITTRYQKTRRMALLLTGACALAAVLTGVGYGSYQYAVRHSGITRIVSK